MTEFLQPRMVVTGEVGAQVPLRVTMGRGRAPSATGPGRQARFVFRSV